MTWTAVKTFIAGAVLPASDMNTYVSGNTNELRGGGLAIASQASKDFLYASSASQLARLAAVDGRVPRYTTAGGWAMAALSGTPYAATLANVLNTTSETAIVTFDVPANEWADGDIIWVDVLNLEKNNSGSTRTVTVKVNCGAGAQVTIVSGASWTAGATEYTNWHPLKLIRRGTGVEVFGGGDSGRADWGFDVINPIGQSTGVSTPTNFTTTFTVSIKVTLSAADANFYIKPQSARIWRQNN